MKSVDDDERIRKGLKFLARANKALIRASLPLERITGNPKPPGVPVLLGAYSFSVGGNDYAGMLTQGQSAYLQGYTATPRKFADAIARILINNNAGAVGALGLLDAGLGAPTLRRPLPGSARSSRVVVGCCIYDSTQSDGITQTYCEGGLLGDWDKHNCIGKPGGGRTKPSPKK